MKLGDMQVSRSKRQGQAPKTFPTHASVRPFAQPKIAVNWSKRGPEKSRPVNVGKGKPLDKAVRRDLFR